MRRRVLFEVSVRFWNSTGFLNRLFLLRVINTVVAGAIEGLSFAVRSWLCRSQSGRPPTHLGFFFFFAGHCCDQKWFCVVARLFLSEYASGISQTAVVWNKRVGVNIWKGNLHQPNQNVGPLSGSSGLIWLADLLLPMSPQCRQTWASVSWRPRSPPLVSWSLKKKWLSSLPL